jgi:hypothetical protein
VVAVSTVVPIGMSDRRLPQAGRIRIGEKTSNRKGRTSIDTFKFTSSDVDLLRPLAEEYGGIVEVWNEPASGDRWALRTEATKIRVVLPPEPLSQHYELWNPQLQRRCNGITCALLTATPDDADFQEVDCICVRKGVLECKYVLRLNVLLSEVESLGTWRLDTSSEHARKEIPAVVDAIQGLQEHGFHRAVLRIDKRRKPGKVFNVPVLDPGVSIGTLTSGDTRLGQLPVAPRIAPVGELGAAAGEGVPSSSPAATSDDEPDRDMADHLYGQGTFQSAADDEVVDAEIVEEIVAASPHADLEPDNLMYAREFFARVKDGPTKERNRWMRRVREIAQANGEPIPANWDAVPGHILNRLAEEADV